MTSKTWLTEDESEHLHSMLRKTDKHRDKYFDLVRAFGRGHIIPMTYAKAHNITVVYENGIGNVPPEED